VKLAVDITAHCNGTFLGDCQLVHQAPTARIIAYHWLYV
jgi:hypothetical protein